ncbi:MAG: hypothetical protein WC869_11910 [Phycisphaerae bacterium]|jgi:hypothetical protein
MKWYPADWRSDPSLRMCGFAARGLWADLLALMHEAEPYGCLLVNGKPPSPAQLAAMLGGTARQVETLMAELEAAGVFSRDDEGVVYSRRMVRDQAASLEGREWVEKRWANRGPTGGPNRDPNRGGTLPPITQKPEARSKIENQDAPAPNGAPSVLTFKSPEARFFDRGKEVLGRASGGLLTRLLRHHGDNVPLAVASVEVASTKSDPREYIGAIIARHGDGETRPDGLRPGRDVF